MSELYGFKKNLEKVQVRSKSESAAKSHIVPTLISNTPLAAPATKMAFADRTIPELANWNVVVLWCRCGNANHNIICFRGANTQNYLIDALTSTVTRGGYYVDWVNNRIRVRWVDGNASLAPSFVQILAVYGLVQNVDVVDPDTDDEPSGDEGEDIDITGLTEEVQGIRIGVDGTIYETAGEAVRQQYEALAERLDAISFDDVMQQINDAIASIPTEVETWLDEHPEATTTVQDGAITDTKLSSSLVKEIFSPYLFVPYLDAEQTLSGNCFVFVYKNHCTIIDLGNYETFEILKTQLVNRGIDTIDNIIITHWHNDHDGFIAAYSGELANAYDHWKNAFDMADTVFYIPRNTPQGFAGSGGYEAIQASFSSNTINILSNSTVIDWNDIDFSVKNQSDDDYAYYSSLATNDLNYCSAIVYAEYKGVVFLDSSDILAASQEWCINRGYIKTADIVSIPHHGVNGTAYNGFMEMIRPLYAYIANSHYGTQYGLQDPTIGIASFTATIFENVNNKDGVIFDLTNGVCASGSPSITAGRAASGKRIIYIDENVSLTDYQDGTEQHPFKSITTACGHLKGATEINLLSDVISTAYISGVQGVVIINGNDHQIGGVNIGNGAHVQINNVKTKSDYGIYINDSYVKMESCTITTPCSISRSEVLAYHTTLNNSKFAKACTDSKINIATIKGTADDDYIVSGGTRSTYYITDNQVGKGISSTFSSVYNTSKGYETDDYLSFNPSNRTVTDLNDAPYGIVYIGSGVTNAPESYCLVFTIGVGGNMQQIAFPVSSTPAKFYVRKKSSTGNWIAWRQVSTTT